MEQCTDQHHPSLGLLDGLTAVHATRNTNTCVYMSAVQVEQFCHRPSVRRHVEPPCILPCSLFNFSKTGCRGDCWSAPQQVHKGCCLLLRQSLHASHSHLSSCCWNTRCQVSLYSQKQTCYTLQTLSDFGMHSKHYTQIAKSLL